jgi:hypothetical protein
MSAKTKLALLFGCTAALGMAGWYRYLLTRLPSFSHGGRYLLVPSFGHPGWYLMTPPFAGAGDPGGADENAPKSQWEEESAYDSASACEKARAGYDECSNFLHGWQPDGTETICLSLSLWSPSQWHPHGVVTAAMLKEMREAFANKYGAAQCIATDDPRLKGN